MSSLAPQYRQQIVEKLSSIPNRGCPFCGSPQLELLDKVGLLPTLQIAPQVILPNSRQPPPEKPLPVVKVLCGQCGYMLLFSLNRLLAPPQPQNGDGVDD